VYRARDEIEGDGTGVAPLPVQVEVTIEPGRFRVDFTGSGAEGHGTVNCTKVALMAAMRIVFTAITAPRVAANEGLFQPLEVICPARTVFTAERPTPTSTYWEARLVASDLVWRALAEALPESLTAGHYLSVCSEVLRTRNPETGEMALLVEPNAGGWGAGIDKDGEDGLFCMGNGQTYVLSTEVAETRYDVRVERYGFDLVRGGEGKHRGGRGLVREYRMLSEGSVTSSFGRSVNGAWSVAGGNPGTPNYVEVLDPDGSSKARAGKVTRVALREGDLVRLVTGTGGGWGDPRQRSREAILSDLRAGLIDETTAAETYGLKAKVRA
jgi:N-methylhydantoinase B